MAGGEGVPYFATAIRFRSSSLPAQSGVGVGVEGPLREAVLRLRERPFKGRNQIYFGRRSLPRDSWTQVECSFMLPVIRTRASVI
jgi:hypothetical protein